MGKKTKMIRFLTAGVDSEVLIWEKDAKKIFSTSCGLVVIKELPDNFHFFIIVGIHSPDLSEIIQAGIALRPDIGLVMFIHDIFLVTII